MLALLLCPVVVLAGLWLALHSEAGHRWLLKRLDRTLQDAAGIELEAAEMRLAFRTGHIELDDLQLRAVGADLPFLTIRRLTTEIELRQLFDKHLLVRSLQLDEPLVDLGAPLPTPRPTPADTEPGAFAISVEQLRASAGAVRGGPLAEANSWLESWSLNQVELTGSLREDELALELGSAQLAADLRDTEPLDASLRTSLRGPLAGPWRIDDLVVDGRGIQLDGNGEFGTGSDDPKYAELHLKAEPAAVLGEQAAGSRLAFDGRLDLRQWTGDAHIEAHDLPAELAEPWIGSDTLTRLGAAGSRLNLNAEITAAAGEAFSADTDLAWRRGQQTLLSATTQLTAERRPSNLGPNFESLRGSAQISGDGLAVELLEPLIGAELLDQLGARGSRASLQAELVLDPDQPAPVSGQGRLHWRRGDLRLLNAQVRQAASSATPRVSFTADLLPGAEGRRHLTGSLLAPSWAELGNATLRSTRLELDLPELQAVPEQLSRALPGFSLAALDDLPLRGALQANADIDGPVISPAVIANATWQPVSSSELRLEASGEPLASRGQVTLEATDFDLAVLEQGASGLASFELTAEGEVQDFAAELELTASNLLVAEAAPLVDRLHLRASSNGRRFELAAINGAFGATTFAGEGGFALDQQLDDGRLRLVLTEPLAEVEGAVIELGLDAGTLLVSMPEIHTTAGRATLDGRLPLAALRRLPQLTELASRLPASAAEGLIELRFALPGLDSRTLLPLFGLEDLPERLAGDLYGELVLDPAQPAAARGEIELSAVVAEVPEHSVRVEGPLRLRLDDQRVTLEEFRLNTDQQPFSVAGQAALEPDWSFDDPPTELLGALDIDARGNLDLALLNPLLAGTGAVASGNARINAHATGPIDRLEAWAEVRAPEAEISLARPYATRLEGLTFDLRLHDGVGTLENGQATLNGGPLRFSGSRQNDGGLALRSDFEAVSYRLDYGLATELAGQLRLTLPATGRGRLAGEVVVERGVLRRDLDLERELLNILFPPAELAREIVAEAEDPYGLDLDLQISTRDGISVKNNLADLRLDWQPLRVRGTILAPAIEGSIELRPDGLLTLAADGVVARIEPGSRVVFDGQPAGAPIIELRTTSSLEDPSIRRRGTNPLFKQTSTRQLLGAGTVDAEDDSGRPTNDPQQATTNALGLGDQLGGYYASRLASRLLAGSLSLRPVPIFGETDTGASITLSRDFSPSVTLALALDLREAEAQTYILDLHQLRGLPTLRATIINTRDDSLGFTLEQAVELGGGPGEESGPRLGQLTVEAPPTISSRALRRALDLGEGDLLPAGARFDLEVAAADYLHSQGYPEARVRASIDEGERRRDVQLSIEPGPHAEVEFAGDLPGRKLRRNIAELYRAGVLEQESLEEIRQSTTRALRLEGFLEPRVEIQVELAAPESATSDRRVVVTADGGQKLKLAAPAFQGIEEDEATALATRFASPAERAELATKVPGADDKLLALLRSLGYVEPAILSRHLDGEQLTVELGTGGRRRVAEVRIEGLEDGQLSAAEIARLRAVVKLAAGNRATAAAAARAARQLEDELHRQGWADSRVGGSMEAIVETPLATTVRLRVDLGQPFRLAEVSFTGLRNTREGWLRRALRLPAEASLDEQAVADARRRLGELGLFTRVRANVRRSDAGVAALEFDLEERPRYRLSYGARWEEGVDTAAKVEVIDRNFFGRGITLGLDARYETNLRQVRLLTRWPRFLGSRANLELFAEGSEEREAGLLFETLTSTVQLSLPFGEHWTGRFYGRHRRLVVTDEDPDPFFPFDFDVTSPFLGLQLIYDSRNDRLLPSRGLFASADLSGSDEFLSSELRFVRFFGQVNMFRPAGRLAGRRLTWAQSVRVGLGRGLGGQQLDRADRFFAGGAYSVRGYPNRSLGPQEQLIDILRPLGGEALLVINEELRFPVWGDLGGLLFIDAGNVWADTSDFGSDLATAIGLGVRANTPLGLLRLDLAHPLDRRDGDRSLQTYFGFGTTF